MRRRRALVFMAGLLLLSSGMYPVADPGVAAAATAAAVAAFRHHMLGRNSQPIIVTQLFRRRKSSQTAVEHSRTTHKTVIQCRSPRTGNRSRSTPPGQAEHLDL